MKSIYSYKAIIIDMDGTLYYQKPVRICMAMELFLYYLLHFNKIKELFILKKYREIREKESSYKDLNFINNQYEIIAKKFNVNSEYVDKIVKFWMYEKPLKYIFKYADKKLLEAINKLKNNKIEIIIYSDYPVKQKLEVLDLNVNYTFSANDKEILCLKPNPKAIKSIMKRINLIPKDVLFLGDRYEKDGKSAQNVGMDYYILSSSRRKRKKQLREIFK